MSEWAAKRFWTAAEAVPVSGGFAVQLDGRAVRTPAKAPLVLPGAALAGAIAAEWAEQGEQIAPETMPLTRAANSAIDKVTPQRGAVVDMLAQYGETDLLCYRAEGPESLVAEQHARWDPPLDWAAEAFRAPLIRIEGVIPQDQPADSVARLRAEVDAMEPFALTAFHDLVVFSGSLILALAVRDDRMPVAEAAEVAELDAIWQERLWGTDEEAAEVRARKAAALADADRFLRLSRRD